MQMNGNRKEAGVLKKKHGAWTGAVHTEVKKRSWGRLCCALQAKIRRWHFILRSTGMHQRGGSQGGQEGLV